MSHRDYVFLRKTKLISEPDRWCIIGRSDSSESVDVVKSVVRVEQYEQTIAFQRNESGTGTKVFMYYFDNPGGSLPTWLINWAAKVTIVIDNFIPRLFFPAMVKVRFKRLDLRFLEIGALRVVFTKRDPEFPGISGQVV
eukprot:sb/3474352/